MANSKQAWRHLPDFGPECTEWAIETLFGAHRDAAWVAAVKDIKEKGDWTGGRYLRFREKLRSSPDAGHYVNQTLIREFGARTNEDSEAGLFVFFDDVGELGVNPHAKMDKDWLDLCGPAPTMVTETSQGNFQYFFAFNRPVPPVLFKTLVKAFKANTSTAGGFIDASGIVRYGRLPSGMNVKPGRDSFITRLVEGSGRKFDPLELAKLFQLRMLTTVEPNSADAASGPDECSIEEIRALLLGEHAPLRNDSRFDDREDYVTLLHFVKGASGGSLEGLDLINEWGASEKRVQVPTNDPEVVWDLIHSPRGGADALWFMARKMDPYGAARVGFAKFPLPDLEPDETPELELFDVGDEDGNISPREWLLGTTFCRAFLSGLIGAGAGGKTTIRILQLLSLAANRNLSGEKVFERSRVLIVCLEDGMKELRRRVRAAMIHHNITPAEVKGYLILTTPRKLKIAELDKRGKVQEGPLLRTLAKYVDDYKFDLVCIDPTIKAHALGESDNPQMDAFATMLADMAQEKNIAIDLLSHERKAGVGTGAAAGDVNRGRGASSLKDAQRLAKTATGMTEAEAKLLGVSNEARLSLVRVDNAKVNIAPPSRKTMWLRIVGVNIGNGNATYPSGDNVQVAEPWEPAPLMDGLDIEDLNTVLRKLGKGMDNGQKYSLASGATDRAAWRAVQEYFPETEEAKCRSIIKTWADAKMFVVGKYDDPERREPAIGILSAKQIEQGEDPY